MRQRIWYIIIFIIIIALGSSYFFFFKKEVKFIETELVNAIPVNTPIFIKADNPMEVISNLRTDNKWWGDASDNIEFLSKLNQTFVFFDSLTVNNPVKTKFLRHSNLIITFNYEGKDKYNLLYLLNLKTLADKEQLETLISDYCTDNNIHSSQKKYSTELITNIVYEKENKNATFSYAIVKGIFISSSKSLLVEDAIRQLQDESLNANTTFSNIYQTSSSQADFNIFINHKQCGKLLSYPFAKDYKEKIKRTQHLAHWTELDFVIKDSKLLLNGFSLTSPDETDYLNVFKNQEPGKSTIVNAIPSSSWYYLSTQLSDYNQFQQDYEAYLKRKNLFFQRESKIKTIEDITATNIIDVFDEIIKGEVAKAGIRVDKNQPETHNILIVSTKSDNQTLGILKKLQSDYLERKKLDAKGWQETYTMDNQSNFQIYRMPFNNLGEVLFGSLFSDVKTNWFLVYDNKLIFANTYQTLTRFIRANVLKETLGYDYNYDQFSSNLTNRNNLNYFLNLSKSIPLKSTFFNGKVAQSISENENLRNFYGLAWQLSLSNKMFYNNICISYNKELKEEPQTIWQSRLNVSSIFKPGIVKNHNDPLNNDIVLQDKENTFYLVNNSGRIEWKLKLDGIIQSKIHQIDYYRNGKLQYLFNTADKLYLLDRNGNNVANYPINLRSKATNGVNVFDYDNNREYRLFVACEDKKIYAFTKEGKLVNGWSMYKTENVVKQRIQHFRVDGKDYIVASDAMRTYILNRRGAIRVKNEAYFERSENNTFYLEGRSAANEPRITATDKKGTIHYIYFNGQNNTKKIKEFNEYHYFTCSDINNDGQTDYIFAEDNKLMAYDNQNKELFSYKLNSNISFPPNIYRLSKTTRKIGVVTSADEKIHLIDHKGNPHNGFPLEGATPFSIGFFGENSNNFNLVVSSKDAYLYNYFVE